MFPTVLAVTYVLFEGVALAAPLFIDRLTVKHSLQFIIATTLIRGGLKAWKLSRLGQLKRSVLTTTSYLIILTVGLIIWFRKHWSVSLMFAFVLLNLVTFLLMVISLLKV